MTVKNVKKNLAQNTGNVNKGLALRIVLFVILMVLGLFFAVVILGDVDFERYANYISENLCKVFGC